MDTTSPATAELARRLLAFEASRLPPSEAQAYHAIRVCEKLRPPIAKLAGLASYCSLLSRSVALAKAKVPALGGLRVGADGTLSGFEELAYHPDGNAAEQGGALLVAELLGLLVTFIGEPLALLLVRDAWPDAAMADIDLGIKGKS